MGKIQSHVELLGFPAKDKVTGFSGVLTSISHDLYGCIQFIITPKASEGKYLDGCWFDANRIELTGNKRTMELPSFNTHYVLEYGKGAADKPIS